MRLTRNSRFPDVIEVEFAPFEDERGYFKRVFDAEIFTGFGLPSQWVQGNESLSTTVGSVRGLHFQRSPHGETKYVRVVEGGILDVFVDLRQESPTFGRWGSKPINRWSGIVVPKGFAHGFRVVAAPAIVVYQVDTPYAKHHESGIRWNDPELNIDWGGEVTLVSDKDSRLPLFSDIVSSLA